jgi:hypothetical protein
MPGFGVTRFKEALADLETLVDVQEQYATRDYKGVITEYGVTLRLRKPKKEDEYGFLHFHYTPPQGSTKVAKCVAHFKEGHRKVDKEIGIGGLPEEDAYSLYVMLMVLRPPKNPRNVDPTLSPPPATGWKPMYRRITVGMIKDLIARKQVFTLGAIVRSQIWSLDFWEPEAWTIFMNWNAS